MVQGWFEWVGDVGTCRGVNDAVRLNSSCSQLLHHLYQVSLRCHLSTLASAAVYSSVLIHPSMLLLSVHHVCFVYHYLQDKVQDMLSRQLDESDNEAVLQELQQLEDQQLQEDLKHMPAAPTTEAQPQAQQQQQQHPQAESQAAAPLLEKEAEELPSVPKTKVRACSGVATEFAPGCTAVCMPVCKLIVK